MIHVFDLLVFLGLFEGEKKIKPITGSGGTYSYGEIIQRATRPVGDPNGTPRLARSTVGKNNKVAQYLP